MHLQIVRTGVSKSDVCRILPPNKRTATENNYYCTKLQDRQCYSSLKLQSSIVNLRMVAGTAP